jgi:opacity protein-like surface antigen/outer membrane protease
MTAQSGGLLRVSAILSALILVQTMPVAASDLPLPASAPAWTWSGFYIGGQIGALGGTTTFSDPYGPSLFGDKVTANGFLAGLRLGYNWQMAPRWVVGIEADASYLDATGTYTCMQASTTLLGSNCQVTPRALASLAGRVGFVVDPQGRTLVYGKAGAAWTNSDISVTPNNSFSTANFPGAVFPGAATSESTNAWGGTVGAGIERALTPAWSLSLEYDYYRFATAHVSTPDTINVTQAAVFTPVAGATSAVTPDIHVVKFALNYHWGDDPDAAWADAPAAALAAMPVKARPPPTIEEWEVDAGTRYWYSTGRSKNTSGAGSLTSQLTYDNLTGHSGELFARVDTPSEVFVKGFAGTGAITSGKQNDEDWGLVGGTAPPFVPTAFEVTQSDVSGWLQYAAADVGYNVLHDRSYRIGPFVGYSYFHQTMNALGCAQLVLPGSVCDPPMPSTVSSITQEDTWQSLRVGVSAQTTIWDGFGINGDLAYLPYAHFSGLDTHWMRQPVAFFPQQGTGRGVQAELILLYRVAENLTLGVGGRYWAMWSTDASQSCHGGCDLNLEPPQSVSTPPGPFTTNTQRYGMFVQMSYRFSPHL